MLAVTALTLTTATQAVASPWRHLPATRAACDQRPHPLLCRVHWWVDRAQHAQERATGHHLKYGWKAEHHPLMTPWRRIKHTWHHRLVHANRLPRAPWTAAWHADAMCVHRGEGAWNADTGNGFYGGMQFDRGTWLANGGGRYAATANLATPFEQLLVAYTTWQRRGWAPWPSTSRECGL